MGSGHTVQVGTGEYFLRAVQDRIEAGYVGVLWALRLGSPSRVEDIAAGWAPVWPFTVAVIVGIIPHSRAALVSFSGRHMSSSSSVPGARGSCPLGTCSLESNSQE